MKGMKRRWLFADQLGPHFLDAPGQPVLLVESYTAGYWSFLARHQNMLRGNHRMRQPLRGLDRLNDLDALIEQENARGSRAP
jgi:hypothetical protein